MFACLWLASCAYIAFSWYLTLYYVFSSKSHAYNYLHKLLMQLLPSSLSFLLSLVIIDDQSIVWVWEFGIGSEKLSMEGRVTLRLEVDYEMCEPPVQS